MFNLAEVDLEKAANAIIILAIGLAGLFGFRRKPPPPEQAALEIRGALVSDAAVDRFVRAMDRNTAALEDKAAAIRENTTQILLMTQALGRNSNVCDDLRESLPGLGQALQTLSIELARSKRD